MTAINNSQPTSQVIAFHGNDPERIAVLFMAQIRQISINEKEVFEWLVEHAMDLTRETLETVNEYALHLPLILKVRFRDGEVEVNRLRAAAKSPLVRTAGGGTLIVPLAQRTFNYVKEWIEREAA